MSGFIVTQLCDLSASHMLAVWHKEVPEVWLAAIIITGIMQAGNTVGSGGKCLDGVCVTYVFTWLCVICASTFVMCACIYLCTVTVVRNNQIWMILLPDMIISWPVAMGTCYSWWDTRSQVHLCKHTQLFLSIMMKMTYGTKGHSVQVLPKVFLH